jgi:GABA(A) receptor-associated protein
MPAKKCPRKETKALARSGDDQIEKTSEASMKDELSAEISKAEHLDDDAFASPANSTSQVEVGSPSARAQGTHESTEDMLQTMCVGGAEAAVNNSMQLIRRTNSGTNHMPSDVHVKRRITGAAATMGGTAGVLLSGPLAGVALGAAAAYVSTREDTSGKFTRKVSAAYVKGMDRATDAYIKAADFAIEEGRQHLAKELDSVANSKSASVPAPLRAGLRRLSTQLQPTAPRGSLAHKDEAARMVKLHPDRIPVVCTKSSYSDLPQIEMAKFAVPGTMLCGEFKYIVHKNIVQAVGESLRAEQTIYIFVNGVVPKTTALMSELYQKFRDEDGFLHVTYGAENTLG